TRQAIRFLETLQEWNAAPDRKAVDSQYWPLIVKAMLIHGAGWGDLENQISQLFEEGDAGQKRRHRLKRLCTQFLGHGPADFARGTVCTDQRVIALGFGQLAAEGAHLYRFPLPQALNAVKVKKKLTLTLTWFSPIDPGHRDYAMADLWFDPPKKLLAKRLDITHTAVRRGTVQHEILEGAQAVPITEDDVLDIQVNCMPRAGGGTLPPIDYALLVSLEVAEPLSASIYNQVKTKLDQIAARVPIRPQ
ncbi:MAG: hypothetical protein ACRD4Q_13875, partial [Candidatus Acidiferrales bacterium]